MTAFDSVVGTEDQFDLFYTDDFTQLTCTVDPHEPVGKTTMMDNYKQLSDMIGEH